MIASIAENGEGVKHLDAAKLRGSEDGRRFWRYCRVHRHSRR
jgi:hypothetical protein